MDSLLRKAASHAKLKPLGIAINDHLPLIESEEEVELRSREELLRRLVALSAEARVDGFWLRVHALHNDA